jgi:probable HAF family extracellular repeat protein
MKHAILLFGLAVAVASCRDHPIAAPADGPQFAATKDCDDPKWQDRPACTGGNGDEGPYDVTDLGALPGRKISPGDPLLIAGMSETAGGDTTAVVWTVSAAGVRLDVLPLADGFSDASAYGIDDHGTYVSGYADTHVSGDLVRLAARWDWNGSWQMTPLDPLTGYLMGISLAVNEQGHAVGWSTAGDSDTRPQRVATLWPLDGTASALASPLGGVSRARGINNQGYIVGESWTQADAYSHAILWLTDGTPCDLHLGDPQTTEPSRANGITDVFTDGGTQVVLVAGHEGRRARVWKVSVSDCAVLGSWTMSIESDAIAVRRVNGGWEATVNDLSTPYGVPVVWPSSGEHTVLADQGRAVGINGAGQIVGRIRAQGADRATLWLPEP